MAPGVSSDAGLHPANTRSRLYVFVSLFVAVPLIESKLVVYMWFCFDENTHVLCDLLINRFCIFELYWSPQEFLFMCYRMFKQNKCLFVHVDLL